MSKHSKRRSNKIGLPPGTPVHIGEQKAEKVKFALFLYNESQYEEISPQSVQEIQKFKDKPMRKWLNVDGLHDVQVLQSIGDLLGLHPLVVEDIINTQQRPKADIYEDYLYIVLKMLTYDEAKRWVPSEQISIILSKDFVVSFQEQEGDVFDPIRDRIRTAKGRVRKLGADYLAYVLIDSIVDHYFMVLEKLGEDIEELEDELVAIPTPKTVRSIHHLKRELIHLRKAVWPLREMINLLLHEDTPLITDSTKIFLRDVYDHTIHVIDTVETYRDLVSGMLDLYLSSVSNRMNEVMKLLTIIATIFIPLTFVVGIYGMNFEWMPELHWREGYPLILLIMLVIALVMVAFFRKRKWL
ncbi:MAG: magnesium/cobalt transporter CorA [bacterium]